MQTASQKVIIRQDELSESPREWDNLWELNMYHARRDLPQESGMGATEATEVLSAGDADEEFLHHPIHCYEHGNIAFAISGADYPFNCAFDAGIIGFARLSRDKLKEEYGGMLEEAARDRALNVLKGELQAYAAWLNGEVYCFEVVDEDGEFVDGCGGFIGEDWEEAMKEHLPEGLRDESEWDRQ